MKTDPEPVESTTEITRRKRRHFFACKLPWIVIVLYCFWTFILGPAMLNARDSMRVLVGLENATSEKVFVVAVAPKSREATSLVLKPSESKWVRVAGGDGDDFWDQPIVVSAYAPDGSLLKRWDDPASHYEPSWTNIQKLVIQPPSTNAKAVP